MDINEVDSEPDDGSDKPSVELNPLIIGLNDVNINPNAHSEGILNEGIALKYVLSSSDNTAETEDVIIKKLNKKLTLPILVHSNSINQLVGNATGAMFIALAR